ncbi:conserved hypothetical protein [Cupriavidus taiwanensis]|uniref:Uncharacterized protein n=2 Tax=Cupriavidus taiwanensis TaxID=164546 RepID=A0A975ZV38_9BURK|nr:conserved hypothetical protein [Cupriavidus taiwanensis]
MACGRLRGGATGEPGRGPCTKSGLSRTWSPSRSGRACDCRDPAQSCGHAPDADIRHGWTNPPPPTKACSAIFPHAGPSRRGTTLRLALWRPEPRLVKPRYQIGQSEATMPDIRYALRNGGKTSSNGTLIATGQSMFHHDVTVGVEGATCPACKAGGPVMNDCYPSFDIQGKEILVNTREGAQMTRAVLVASLLALSVAANAEQMPVAIIDSCLLFDRPSDASISIIRIEGGEDHTDDVTVPGYQLFTSGDPNNKHTIGYATSKRGSSDFVFVGASRGYINRAVALGKHRPSRVEQPILAAYALLRQHGRGYVCVMESNGNGSAAFVRSAYVGRIPSSKGAEFKLYYKVADVKRFKQ